MAGAGGLGGEGAGRGRGGEAGGREQLPDPGLGRGGPGAAAGRMAVFTQRGVAGQGDEGRFCTAPVSAPVPWPLTFRPPLISDFRSLLVRFSLKKKKHN